MDVYDDEIERLQAELAESRERLKGVADAYWKMRNAAAGYSNLCEETASARRCERDYAEAESLYLSSITTTPPAGGHGPKE